ncbi:MAG: ABC transporter ATP-binding protein, partial [Verrucomicrobiota bacterium]
MPLPAIQVENLSKRYFLRHQVTPHDGLRHRVESALLHPIRSWKNRALQKKSSREEFWPLKDLTFNIQPGEIVGIIGRNGAGKSTLLKILSRITEPTSGHIEIEGRIASLLEVGTGFHPELSGRENIFLNGAILGMSRAEIKSKFTEIVEFAEIEKFLDTPVKRYSSGMYVRLAFAVAAHLDSDILIVDEVLAVGDAQFQKKCLGKMDDISKNGGRTVLLVSHQMAAISNLCPKSIVLHQGRFSFFGPTSDAISHYLGLAETSSPHLPLSSFRPPWASPCITSARLLSLDSTPQDRFPLGAGFTIELSY